MLLSVPLYSALTPDILSRKILYCSFDVPLSAHVPFGFLFYLHTFFQDEGMPHMADSLNVAAPPVHLADVVRDLKRALKPDLYERLIEHSFYYAPSYLPLFQFAEQLRRPLTNLTLMDWEDDTIKERFAKFMGKYYSDNDLPEILDRIGKYLKKSSQ